jgi:hypothetical protein
MGKWFYHLSNFQRKLVVITAICGGISTTAFAFYGGYSFIEKKSELETWVMSHKAEADKYPVKSISEQTNANTEQIKKMNDLQLQVMQRLSSIEGKLDLLIEEKKARMAINGNNLP